jgi:hypothetical protein
VPTTAAAHARRAAAVVGTLASAPGWQSLRDDHRLDDGESGRAAAWALSVLLAELARNPRTMEEFDG